jgi:hypothetical protein
MIDDIKKLCDSKYDDFADIKKQIYLLEQKNLDGENSKN